MTRIAHSRPECYTRVSYGAWRECAFKCGFKSGRVNCLFGLERSKSRGRRPPFIFLSGPLYAELSYKGMELVPRWHDAGAMVE